MCEDVACGALGTADMNCSATEPGPRAALLPRTGSTFACAGASFHGAAGMTDTAAPQPESSLYRPCPMLTFDKEVVLITGAGRGIGAAAARMFASLGAKVVVNDLSESACEEVAASISDAGGCAFAAAADITRDGAPEDLVSSVYHTYDDLTVLVNNAGFLWDGMVHKMTDEQWQRIQDVHTRAPFRLIRAVSKYWRPAAKVEIAAGTPRRRCIVNVSSTSGLHGNIGQANYSTAKMGVVGLTKTVAKEWGRLGIRCNAVAFGMIDTRLTRPKEEGATFAVAGHHVRLGVPEALRPSIRSQIPMQRYGTRDEAAGAIVFLASPLAGYVTGHTLEVTGGLGI